MKRLLLLFVAWICVPLCYDGLSYNSVNLGGNPHADAALGVIIEIPSYAICLLIFDG